MDLWGPFLPPEQFLLILMAIWQSSFPTTLSERILLLFLVANTDNWLMLLVRWLPLMECHSPDALNEIVINEINAFPPQKGLSGI